ncbi:MAG: acyl-CoA dehydrogenase family protein [Acidimicrobiales bacterium]
MLGPFETHEVVNQSPPLEGHDVYSTDRALVEAVEREGAGWAGTELAELGILTGAPRTQELARQANEHRPELHTHDRTGHRIDMVEYHPAYHELMGAAVAHGLHAAPWSDPRDGAHVARAAKVFVWYQAEAGHVCPVSMTYSVVPALRHQPDVAAEWEPRLTSTTYDATDGPASTKAGATSGMALTEKQGGSDVRANTTTATPLDGDGSTALLTGHKWFCSAPMSDGFLMLAQAPNGLTCYWVPRWRPDGTKNPIYIQRLKDKLGDRSNASSEIELAAVWAQRVGEEGRGVRTIIEMVNHTRLDCAIGSASVMRQGVAQASWHAAHRAAFGALLADQPLMQNVLADLALESEAATAAVLRLARSYDREADEHEALLQRVLTPVVKYWTCKRAPQHAAEALECLGGNGFVEESPMPRLFRQSPVNGVWEGSGNVICLDVLRAMAKSPRSVDAFWEEVNRGAGSDARLDGAIHTLQDELAHTEDLEGRARRLVEEMAVVFEASLLVQHAPGAVADAFCASRLAPDRGRAFGTLPRGTDVRAIVERAAPWAAAAV